MTARLLFSPVFLLFTLLFTCAQYANAQRAGGNAAYSFLGLPAGSLQTALGGHNTSIINKELSAAYMNPALLRQHHHQQVSVNFTPIAGGVKHYFASAALHHAASDINFAAQVQYIGYGSIQQTDIGGNIYGEFSPRDYVVQVTASRSYLTRWQYGASIKFIQSNYGPYRSSAAAIDLGATYLDSARGWQAGIVIKNMGVQLRQFANAGTENLPFDLQLGVSKKLLNAPLQFSITTRHLNQLILFKPDSSYSTADQILQHFVAAAQAYVADKIELTLGYNHLLRQELSIPNTANGLTGFSFGAGVLLSKLQLRYARSLYTNSRGYHQFGITADFSR